MKRKSGITLLELLTVVAIIALLMALMLPVIHGARARAHRTACSSNLHQLAAAVVMYRNDYSKLPSAQVLLLPYVKDTRIFACPADPFTELGGSSSSARLYAMRLGYHDVALSYGYIMERMERDTYRRLSAADPNHGVFVCALHDKCNWASVTTDEIRGGIFPDPVGGVCLDGVLRARIDGSVEWKRVPMRDYECPDGTTSIRDSWRLMSDVPCPPDVCDESDC